MLARQEAIAAEKRAAEEKKQQLAREEMELARALRKCVCCVQCVLCAVCAA